MLGTALVLAVVGCGGLELPTQSTDGLEQSMDVAPMWMAELDLPGCGCQLPTEPGDLLIHPFDAGLVIAMVDGQPECVGLLPHEPGKVDVSAARASVLPIHGGGIGALATAAPEDDPVPIKPDSSGEESGAGNTDPETGGSNDRPNEGSSVPGGTVQVPSAFDDPVPIRGNKVLVNHRPFSSE